MYVVSIDNLTLVGTPTKNATQILGSLPNVESAWISTSGRYHYNYKFAGGAFVQITHFSMPKHEIRLEFNPNNYKTNETDIIRTIKCMRSVHATRIDTAIDIHDLDLSEYEIIDYKTRKRQIYLSGNMEMETTYLGAKTSDEQVRIYNKQKEQKVSYRWWRIEGQVRGDKAKQLDYNPFRSVLLVRPTKLDLYDVKTRAMVDYLTRYPEELKNLSKPARSKYKKLMGAMNEKTPFDIASIYNENKENLYAEVTSWIAYAREDVAEIIMYSGKEQSVLNKVTKDEEEDKIKKYKKALCEGKIDFPFEREE